MSCSDRSLLVLQEISYPAYLIFEIFAASREPIVAKNQLVER